MDFWDFHEHSSRGLRRESDLVFDVSEIDVTLRFSYEDRACSICRGFSGVNVDLTYVGHRGSRIVVQQNSDIDANLLSVISLAPKVSEWIKIYWLWKEWAIRGMHWEDVDLQESAETDDEKIVARYLQRSLDRILHSHPKRYPSESQRIGEALLEIDAFYLLCHQYGKPWNSYEILGRLSGLYHLNGRLSTSSALSWRGKDGFLDLVVNRRDLVEQVVAGTLHIKDAITISEGRIPKTKSVYVIQLGESEIHKIGISQDVLRRLKDLSKSVEEDLKLVHSASFDEGMAESIEKALHKLYSVKQVNDTRLPCSTEWFALSDEDVQYIKSLEE